MSKVKLGIVQMDVQAGDKSRNLQKVRSLTDQFRDEPVDIVVLPEMWNTGYAWSEINQLAEAKDGPTNRFLRELAIDLRTSVIGGSIPLKVGKDIFNTTLVYDHQGKLKGEYRKIHLFDLMLEKHYLQAGNDLALVDFVGWQAGLMICYDLRFPELARQLAVLGAKVLFLPAQFPQPRVAHWETLIKARAIENQLYVVAVNRVGTEQQTKFFGKSLVVDPWGEVLATGGAEEEVLRVEIDLTLVDQVRQKIPCWADRRADIYYC